MNINIVIIINVKCINVDYYLDLRFIFNFDDDWFLNIYFEKLRRKKTKK